LRDPNFDPLRVRLVRQSEPIAVAASELYKDRPPRIPISLCDVNFGGVDAEEVYLMKGPIGEMQMATGRDVLNQIIDAEAAFFEKEGRPPKLMKLPVLMAYDLAKCGRNELGELSGRVFQNGITVFEKEGFHGMEVEIVRDRQATLEFE
jgi:hypothetical protein